MEQPRLVTHSMTCDEVSMERSKTFVKSLQELKNLRPQLYSAAEYCEKSYLCSEQKQMVLNNLRDYAVRTLVNAVDHLGTVAFKLNDLLEQQTVNVSAMGQNLSCLNQQLLTCQTYSHKEGSRQQQLLVSIPRHHKHYILPNAVNKKIPLSSPQVPYIYPSGIPASKTLSWHMATKTKSTLKGTTPHAAPGTGATIKSANISGVFCFSNDGDNNKLTKSLPSQTFAASFQKDSISNQNRREEVVSSRNQIHKTKKVVLAALFAQRVRKKPSRKHQNSKD